MAARIVATSAHDPRQTYVHSSGSDQDGIVLLPELDTELAQRIGARA